MADGHIAVTEGAGKNLQTFENTVGGVDVHSEAVSLTDTSGAPITTLPISAASLPLPALASTSTKQSDGTQKTQVVDGGGNVIAATANALNVSVQNTSVTVTGTIATNESPDGTSTYAPTNATSTAYEASHVIKGSAGVLFAVTGFNSSASDQFIQIHDASVLPANGVAPVITFLLRASRNFSISFGGKFGRFFATGIVICNSSTGPTKTIGASDCWFDAQFK
jgi:hypothetical protein